MKLFFFFPQQHPKNTLSSFAVGVKIKLGVTTDSLFSQTKKNKTTKHNGTLQHRNI